MASSVSTIHLSPASLAVHQFELQRRRMLPRQSNSVVAYAPKLGGVGRVGIRNGSRLVCYCSMTPGGSGDNESKSVLDAFFLGKAVAEALNERIESTVGEILSTVGRLQAEQQKQVQEFQDEVLERAKRAKEKAAREAKVAQGLPIKSTATNTSPVNSTSTYSPAARPPTTLVKPNKEDPPPGKDDTVIGISNNL